MVFPYALCGPPWISRISGYFFDGSKDAGFRIQPWIFFPSKLVYQISSGSGSDSCDWRSSLKVVSFLVAADWPDDRTSRSPTIVGVERTIAKRAAEASAV